MGVNTTSGFSLLTCRATHGSRALVGPETIAQGRSGSIGELPLVADEHRDRVPGRHAAGSASTMRAAYRLMPSWCSSRV